MMVVSPVIIGQVAWFILIDKRPRRADICIPSYKAPPDGVSYRLATSATRFAGSIPRSDRWTSCISHGLREGIVQDAVLWLD